MFKSNDKYFPYLLGLNFITLIIGLFVGSLGWWALAFFMFFCYSCLGITVTYHRKLTHNSYECPTWITRLFTILGCLGGTGSSVGWVAVHRTHHEHSDTQYDPHSPHTGSVWGIFLNNYNFTFNKWMVRDLITDPFHKFVHHYYFLILLLVALVLGLISLKLLIFALTIPMFLTMFVSSLSVYLGHYWGYKNFELQDESRNSFFHAFLTHGDGWHNNHHKNPGKSNFRVKWWEFDLSYQIIKLIRV